jgi:hypothetical protein
MLHLTLLFLALTCFAWFIKAKIKPSISLWWIGVPAMLCGWNGLALVNGYWGCVFGFIAGIVVRQYLLEKEIK